MADSVARALALSALSQGGGGGTSDYEDLENKPQINGVELVGDLSTEDIGIDIPEVPTNVSAFTNDAGYLTSHQDISGLATKQELQAVEEEIPTVPTNVSAFTNDAGYLTSHQSLSAYRTSAEQDIIDNGKQGTLTAGENITIENNVISASGGGGSEVSGTNDGTNWTSITIDDDTYAIPSGGGSSEGAVRYDEAQSLTNAQFNQVMSNLKLGAEINHIETDVLNGTYGASHSGQYSNWYFSIFSGTTPTNPISSGAIVVGRNYDVKVIYNGTTYVDKTIEMGTDYILS